MFHEMSLKLYSMKYCERKVSWYILALTFLLTLIKLKSQKKFIFVFPLKSFKSLVPGVH